MVQLGQLAGILERKRVSSNRLDKRPDGAFVFAQTFVDGSKARMDNGDLGGELRGGLKLGQSALEILGFKLGVTRAHVEICTVAANGLAADSEDATG